MKSPFQHSGRSIQGQIFIIWPCSSPPVAYVVHRFRGNLFTTAVFIFNTVFVASPDLLHRQTDTNQGIRLLRHPHPPVEFAIGTLLAMLTLKWKAPERAQWLWAGWYHPVWSPVAQSCPLNEAFPGYLALWPVISGALVITGRPHQQPLGHRSTAGLRTCRTSATSPYAPVPGALAHPHPLQQRRRYLPRELHRRCCHHPYLHRLAWLLIRFVEKPAALPQGPFVPWLMMKMRFKTIFSVKTWADQLAFILAIFLVAGVPLVAARHG